jgi:hypothetical protein
MEATFSRLNPFYAVVDSDYAFPESRQEFHNRIHHSKNLLCRPIRLDLPPFYKRRLVCDDFGKLARNCAIEFLARYKVFLLRRVARWSTTTASIHGGVFLGERQD